MLATGVLLGLMFPFGKLAVLSHIAPVIWAFWIAAGSAVVLLVIHVLNGRGVRLHWRYLRFYFASALVSLVVPNILIFSVIPQLGAGYTGLLFTLSPIITLALSLLVKLRTPGVLGLIGIAVGFLGALMVAWTRGEMGSPASIHWLIAGLCIPTSLAIGNVYRTMDWPFDAHPTELAVGSNSAAAVMLLVIALLFPADTSWTMLASAPVLAVVQIVVSAMMFIVYYRLQKAGGPLYLSQISYVAAAVALVAGTMMLSERYALLTWIGGAVILVGIAFSILDQARRS